MTKEYKKLYIVCRYDNRKVTFIDTKIYEETETEYIVDTWLNDFIKNIGCRFPKKYLNKPLEHGFATKNINSKKLKEQLERVYKELDKEYEKRIEETIEKRELNKCAYENNLSKIEELRNKYKR